MRAIDRAINRIHPGAATALYDTLYLGSDALLERRGRKVMVVITDGGDTVSKTSYQEAVREAQQAEVILYSIIIVPIENSAGRDIGGEHALIQLSRDTGGKYFYASGLEQLDAAFQQISDELRTQYLIAYYPSTRLSDSDYRRIEIKVNPATKDYPDPSELQSASSHRLLHHACEVDFSTVVRGSVDVISTQLVSQIQSATITITAAICVYVQLLRNKIEALDIGHSSIPEIGRHRPQPASIHG